MVHKEENMQNVQLIVMCDFSPPPEIEMSGERRSRRDMSPQGRKRTAVMMSRDKQTPYQPHRKVSNWRYL